MFSQIESCQNPTRKTDFRPRTLLRKIRHVTDLWPFQANHNFVKGQIGLPGTASWGLPPGPRDVPRPCAKYPMLRNNAHSLTHVEISKIEETAA